MMRPLTRSSTGEILELPSMVQHSSRHIDHERDAMQCTMCSMFELACFRFRIGCGESMPFVETNCELHQFVIFCLYPYRKRLERSMRFGGTLYYPIQAAKKSIVLSTSTSAPPHHHA
jgi:hypothetical protein